jgi:hypothetical protein
MKKILGIIFWAIMFSAAAVMVVLNIIMARYQIMIALVILLIYSSFRLYKAIKKFKETPSS